MLIYVLVHANRPLVKGVKKNSYFSTKTNVVGNQKNHLPGDHYFEQP